MPKKIKLNLNDLNVTSFKTTDQIDNNLKGGKSNLGDAGCDDTGSGVYWCNTATFPINTVCPITLFGPYCDDLNG